MSEASVTKRSTFSMQVCVPKSWDDERVHTFAERENPCGTEYGWSIRREGDQRLKGNPERAQCDRLPDHVHIMLDA